MLELENTTGSDLRFTGGVAIPAGGRKEVSEDTFNRLKLKDRFFQRNFAAGNVVFVAGEAEPEPITRDTIDGMRRAELMDLLMAHGVTEAEMEGKYVSDLRDMLKAVMFV